PRAVGRAQQRRAREFWRSKSIRSKQMTNVFETGTPQNIAPFLEADAGAAPGVLRAQMEENGYLFFRALVPEKEVLRVRRAVLELCSQAGWLDPQRELMDGIAAPNQKPLREGMTEYTPVYRQV